MPVNTPRPAFGIVDLARYNLHLSLSADECVCSRVRNGNASTKAICVDNMTIIFGHCSFTSVLYMVLSGRTVGKREV